jgi:MFS family permease
MAIQRQSPVLLIVLALTQTIGWGSTYYLPSVLARDLERDLQMSTTIVFSAITLMLITSAIISPRMGAYLDKNRPGMAMTTGSLLLSLGLAIIATAQGPIQYLAGWWMIGIGSASALTLGAQVAVVQRHGAQARHFLTLLMLTGGVSVGLFWPLSNWLLGLLSWREVTWIYAAIHLLVCAPLHFLFVGRGKPSSDGLLTNDSPVTENPMETALLSVRYRKAGLFWLVVAFAAAGFVSWGLPLHYVALFSEGGLPVAVAVGIGALTGPSQIVARFVQWLVLDRFGMPVRFVVIAAAASVLVLAMTLLLPFTYAMALTFTLVFGFTNGVISMARGTLPLVLFGAGGFGSLLGQIMKPLNFAFAAAPMFYAYLMQSFGGTSLKWLSLMVFILATLAFWRLSVLVARSRTVPITPP